MDDTELTEYPAEDVLVVEDPAKLRALGGELRSRIVVLLRERAASATELAKVLGVPKGTVGYHLKVLESAGLIRVVATKRVRAVTEKFYGRVARAFLVRGDRGFEEDQSQGAVAARALRRGADEVPLHGVDPEFIRGGILYARMRPAAARRYIRRLEKLVSDFVAEEDPQGEQVFALAVSIFPTSGRLPERGADA